MCDEKKDIPFNLLRCPSVISTTDGGWTPLTDFASPLVRTPDRGRWDLPQASVIATTNLLKVSLAEHLRADEYLVPSPVDLVICLFDRLVLALGSERILVMPEVDQTRLLVISGDLLAATGAVPLHIDGLELEYIKSHTSGCSCTVCVKGFSQVIDGHTKIGKFEYLQDENLPIMPHLPRTNVAVSAHKAKFTQEGGSLSIACDMLVKWISWSGDHSVAELLRLATLSGKTRLETSLSLTQSWVFTSYNGKPYRIKRICFDMTPVSSFFDKKSNRITTYAEFLEEKYGVRPLCLSSPLLEAYPEKRSETCLLLPEFCFVFRPSATPVSMHTVHAQTRIRQRQSCIDSIQDTIRVRSNFENIIRLDRTEAEGTILSPRLMLPLLPVRSSPVCRWAILVAGDDGPVDFDVITSRLMRNCPPLALIRCETIGTIPTAVRRLLAQTEGLDLIIVILKNRAWYASVKYACLVECGIPCQVIKPDTLNRGWFPDNEPLMSDLETQIRAKLGLSGTMKNISTSSLVVLDFHRFGDLSIFSTAWTADSAVQIDYIIHQSAAIDEAEMAQQFMALMWRNVERLPQDPLILLAQRRGIPKSVPLAEKLGTVFPRHSLVVVCPRTDVRLFGPGGSNMSPGFCFDSSIQGLGPGFYLVPHKVEEGNALPVLFVGITVQTSMETIKNAVWQSYSGDATKRMPELFQHTMRLSKLIGIHIRKIAGRDVAKCLEKSGPWKKLKSCFYL